MSDIKKIKDREELAALFQRASERVTVTTDEELDALPLGTIVRKAPEYDSDSDEWIAGGVAELRPDSAGQPAWFFVELTLGYRSHQADLTPALVIYHPDEELVRIWERVDPGAPKFGRKSSKNSRRN